MSARNRQGAACHRVRGHGLAFWLLLSLLATPAWAQPQDVVVSYDTAKFSWSYPVAAEASITTFTMDCNAGAVMVPIDKTLREKLVKEVVPGPGRYTCTLYAFAGAMGSEPSNVVAFGVRPAAVTNLEIVAQ